MIFVNGQKVSEVICLSCLNRWIAARPLETKLSVLECPCCYCVGTSIETGETVTAEELIKKAAGEEGEQHE